VDFAIAEDERTFRNEIRAFLRSELTPEAVAEAQSEERISTAGRQFIRKLGERKWISLTWPPEWDRARSAPTSAAASSPPPC